MTDDVMGHRITAHGRALLPRLKTLLDLVDEGLTDALIAERFGWDVRTVIAYRLFLQAWKRGEGRRSGPKLKGRGAGRWARS
jgi:hypothetical protein